MNEKAKIKLSELTDMYDIEDDSEKDEKQDSKREDFEHFTMEIDEESDYVDAN